MIEFLLVPMGVLAPSLRTTHGVAHPPIKISGNFPLQVSKMSPKGGGVVTLQTLAQGVAEIFLSVFLWELRTECKISET